MSKLPLYKSVVIGEDSYHVKGALDMLAGSTDVTRAWYKGQNVASVQLRGGGVVKSLHQFDRHGHTEETFLSLMEECQRHGVERPASYSSVFHEKFKSPRVSFSVNKYFADEFAGGWQEAIEPGMHQQHLRKYDLNSAYLWAGSQGLPNVSRGLDYSEQIKPNGLYLLEIVPKIGTPFPFCRTRLVVAEAEDVETYSLEVLRVVGGVTWGSGVSGQQIIDTVQRFSFWKQIGRSYWGRWASNRKVRCRTFDYFGDVRKEWELGNPFRNYVWATIIVNRVKRRLFTSGVKMLHVFVDSIITPGILPINEKIGGWKLEKEYPTGLKILGTGWYGVPGQKPEKHVGMSLEEHRQEWPRHVKVGVALGE